MTFKKSDALREIAASVPLDRLLVETDAPYLAPEPYRGRTNEPAYVVHTAAALAEVKGLSPDALAAATTENFFRLFAKVPRPAAQAPERAPPLHELRATILGCGSSGGVPRVGAMWGACDPANPKNRRRRCGLLVERLGRGRHTTVLVDTSPDLREQLLSVRAEALDGVLYTHDHADHTHGIDDLRYIAYAMKRRIDIWVDAPTRASLEERLPLLLHGRSPARATRPSSMRTRSRRPRRSHRRADGASSRRCRSRRITARSARSGSASAVARLLARYQRRAGGLPPAAAGARRVDRRCAARHAAPEPFQRQAGAGMDRAAELRSAPSSRT